jgi:rhamnose transport system permease protein
MATSTAEPTTTRRGYPSYSRNVLQRILLTREAAVIAALVVVYVYSLVNVQFFDGPLTTYNLFKEYAPILMLALPMTLIIITGEIDLSVASTLGVSAAFCGVLVTEHDVSMPTAMILTVVLGLVLGAFNGVLVAYVGLPSLAVTIGTLALYRGLAEGLIKTDRIAGFPPAWQDWPTERIGGTNIPNIMIPVAVLVVVFAVLLHFTSFGRGVYEIGLSPEAAHFSGVNVARTKLLLFVMSGVVASLAGLYVMLRADSAATDTGIGFELKVIASVLLGGVSIFGGRGAMHGVIAGVLLIAVLNSALLLSNQGSEIIQIIIGCLLVASVIASSFLPRIRELFPRRTPADRPGSTPTLNNGAGEPSRKAAQ